MHVCRQLSSLITCWTNELNKHEQTQQIITNGWVENNNMNKKHQKQNCQSAKHMEKWWKVNLPGSRNFRCRVADLARRHLSLLRCTMHFGSDRISGHNPSKTCPETCKSLARFDPSTVRYGDLAVMVLFSSQDSWLIGANGFWAFDRLVQSKPGHSFRLKLCPFCLANSWDRNEGIDWTWTYLQMFKLEPCMTKSKDMEFLSEHG